MQTNQVRLISSKHVGIHIDAAPLAKRRSLFASGIVLIAACSFCMGGLIACVSSEELEFKKAQKAERNENYETAFQHYQKIVNRHLKSKLAIASARHAARLAHYNLSRFDQAVGLYKHVVLYSTDQGERVYAQQQIADIHLTRTQNYNQAIVEYSRLLDLPHTAEEDARYRLAIARSYFYLNNFYQAQVEIDKIVSRGTGSGHLFDALLLKANILMSAKELTGAITVLQHLMRIFPKRSQTESVALILAVCYEEQKNFAKAIETLRSIEDTYPRKEFIKARIKTLKERQSYLPGATGWKK